MILSVRAIGPALAADCTVVLKLLHQTGPTNGLFAEAVAAVDLLPPGVLNLFTESGSAGASELLDSPDVDAISFTGSTQTGRLIAAKGARTLKRMNLVLGGKTPLIVFDNADCMSGGADRDRARRDERPVLLHRFACTRATRHADALRTALVEAYAHVRLGDSEDPKAQLGPLIDVESVRRVDQDVSQPGSAARFLVRGGPVTEGPLAAGAFYRPTLVEVDSIDSILVRRELFGPVQTFELFDDENDAIARANATDYGLAASVFTRDASRSRRVGKAIRAGHIWTNCWGVLSEHFEQSGFKQSGVGLLCGPRAIEKFQEMKVYATVDPPLPDAA